MRRYLLSLVLVLSFTSPAWAQDSAWNAGVALSYTEKQFEPLYETFDGEPPQRFIDHESGWQGDFAAGRRFVLNDRFAIGAQAMLLANTFAWELTIPEEPSEFEYSIPYTVVGSVVPTVRIGSITSVFAEVGAGVGRVKENKESPIDSSYDFDEIRGVLALGAGLAVALTDRIDIVGAYRHGRYAGFEFDTHDPSGAVVEHVQDAPRTHGVSVGISWQF